MAKLFSPLGGDTVSPLNAPPVHMGLLTKFNLLAIGLIVATALGIAAFLIGQQIRDEENRLTAQGFAISAMLAEVADEPISSGDLSNVASVLDGLVSDRDIAYVAVLDAQQRPLITRSYGDVTVPSTPLALPTVSDATTTVQRIADGRQLELIARVRTPPRLLNQTDAVARPIIGYIRLGMSFDRGWTRIRANLVGALSVVAALVIIAVVVTLFLTRRLIAPIRQLMRAARAVGAGKLDVYVPAKSSDELGLLTHTFNHMTQRLAESQAEVATYQRTLEDKVTQRTKELEIATAQAYKLAQHDILTGLPNRALLNQRLRQIVAQAARDGHQVACLFLDFDHFKRINDTLGHDAGDQLLQAVAQRLTSAVRESDTVARLGGDEFVLILPSLDPAHAAFEVMTVLTRVRESFLAPFRIVDQTPTLTCSIGVSVYPVDATDPNGMIKQADTAMYAAKDAGRNAYRFYTADMNARIQARLQLETDMRRGLMDDEFFLVYQPQIDMNSGRALGVEALLRWRDPERGIIGPDEFISIAEESGMIQALGARVLRDACRQVMVWHRQNMMLRLSVNLSVQQLQHDSWLSVVEEALKSSGLPARYLDLEITESVIITHPEKAVATLEKLKQMGVSITVDDFGTGYSSLSYLTRLPVQSVKIDQRFVHGLEQNRSDEAITLAIIALSHSIGLRVIAEGVETVAQYEFLKTHGCEEAQGYLISRPLEEPELRSWWMMQEEENRIVGRQHDMWRAQAK
ncbi:MAG TPA: EAL domain-containing protein [Casimicrobiaceae bacterium]|jgi:diguanylate cyclase (GGDEF)-like protein|nr:EAL domain-containing protein [Casimicrobiaceae bacterium]